MQLAKISVIALSCGLLIACSGGGSGHSSKSSPSKASSSSQIAQSSSSLASSEQSSSSSSSEPMAVSSYIVVDQFGYLPQLAKVAVIRDPQTGYDAAESFSPSDEYQLIDLETGAVAYKAAPTVWHDGETFAAAGDKIWWFDFSSVTTPGTYAVLDPTNEVRSPSFKIAADVYKPVLKHALRTFFYQRAGFAKQLPYAEAGWVDGASHLGSGQDTEARLFTDQSNATTARDLSGGWYDAGDYNKYTNWHAGYLNSLLHAYLENPVAWTDDFNIPESGNGIPDIIDEIKWGFDWLIKMQNDDGSVLSIEGLASASPPSAATGPSYYGPASTSATLSSAAAFAFGSKIFASLGNEEFNDYAADLQARAVKAWDWAAANPTVLFKNNDEAYNSVGLGAGQQEVGTIERSLKRLYAAIYLFDATGESKYKTFIDESGIIISDATPWNNTQNTNLLYYANLAGATPNIANKFKTDYLAAMNNGSENWPAIQNTSSAYRSYIGESNFTWGSNRTMSYKGSNFYNLLSFNVDAANTTAVRNAAAGYLNYLHGVNPLAMVYLSNMSGAGAYSSVNEFYHSWFANGSSEWDRVGESAYGPAPGFLVGGPNPSYDWDACCPSSCGSSENNAVCLSISITPPKGQPAMKSYLDFNTSWPLNSWQVTENHNDYQVAYLRLLSKFVN